MKKNFLFVVLFAALFTISCDKDQKDDPIDDPTEKEEYVFYDVFHIWGASKDDVAAYVDKMGGWKKDDELSTDTKIYYLRSNSDTQMEYTFGKDGLEGSGITYFCPTKYFDTFKTDVSTKYGITEWKEYPEMQGVIWYNTSIKESSTNLSIGWSGSYGIEYFYADFSYDPFIF